MTLGACLLLVGLAGCTGSEGTVKMICKDGPIEGCVSGDCFEIEAGASRIWRLSWDGGLITKKSKDYEIRVQDLTEPDLAKTRTVTMEDGETVEWIIDEDNIENEGTVIIVNAGPAMNGCVDDECHYIAAGAQRSYAVTWTGGFYSNPPATVQLYAEDASDPGLTASRSIELEDGETYQWTVAK